MSCDIKIKKIRPGSVLLTLELSLNQAKELLRAIKSGKLRKHDVVNAELKRHQDMTWVGIDFGTSGISLVYVRSLPSKNLSEDDVKRMLKEKDFFDKKYNKQGRGLRHFYETEERYGEKLVIDYTTGLEWQQSGSGKVLYRNAEEYIRKTNEKYYAGFNDWRLPTLEEAMSLMEPEKKDNNLYIAPVFDYQQPVIWTADKSGSGSKWTVRFDPGSCLPLDFDDTPLHVRAVRKNE
jgi:Protein of unknown function (DUF1566)